ncbi:MULTISPECIES: nucleotidyltransferase family protein [unclassified Bradyrhizobium]|uniref:nucleotidyltransferase family protein n=1 Tax=unclassified Bradyrhizobium TaxID=2631580 RepID=UPI002915DF7F|nr:MULTISPECIES: nucleotidyltransferase family protein [unclassified Bradyrhizobium]
MKFARNSLMMSSGREERALIALSMVDVESMPAPYAEALTAHLNWPWIFMQAMQHRVVCILWENLIKNDLVGAAVRCGLTKNWITYAEQLSRANLEKNQLWLDCVERIFEATEAAGLPIACIKGGALIGDIYHPGNRMLGDIDAIAPQSARSEISTLLHELGFRHGTVDPVRNTLVPLSREKRRLWNFSAHLMPKFTIATNDPHVPFFRFAIGFDFFDPHEKYHVPSDAVLERRVRKSKGSNVSILADVDMVVNLCVHIYREAISATFGFMGDNWALWKFCDLRSYLVRHDSEELRERVATRVAEFGIEKPYFFALYYTKMVYGDPTLDAWINVCDPGTDKSFLYEMVDGTRRVLYDRPFADRLFDRGQTIVPGLEPAWARAMNEGEWW